MSSTSPASTQQLIDRVVREVLARLQPTGEQSADAAAPETVANRQTPDGDGSRFALAERVVSLACLSEVPAGVKQICLERSAVVTPAARDWARQQGITWSHRGEMNGSIAKTAWLADTDCPDRLAGLTRQLSNRGLAARASEAETLVDHIADGEASGVVLSDLPAGFLCNACRHRAVRAAAIGDLNELQPITAQMQPNLWIIDMRRATLSKAVALAERAIRLLQTEPAS